MSNKFSDRRLDGSDGSKDSSLDSGTDIKNYTEFKRDVTMAERVRLIPHVFLLNCTSIFHSQMANITMRSETRRSIMTDDSAIGDAESTAHDGDIDSDNDYRHRPLYYPNQDPARYYCLYIY